jgi:DNA-binding NarL/FixJ family response regulator
MGDHQQPSEAIITVLVADDHPMVRRGIVATLEDEADFRVIAEASSGDEAVLLVRQFRPQLVILDINMPTSGLEASRMIKSEFPGIQTVMFSFRQDPEIVRASQEAGASGYIVKGSSGSAVVAALREVLAGRPFFRIDPMPLKSDV